jgi:hypothetical protein
VTTVTPPDEVYSGTTTTGDPVAGVETVVVSPLLKVAV